MEKLLRNKKIRVTPFRLEVLGVFGEFKNAVALSQIEEKLGDFDRITLYRTLKTFQEAGLIHEIVMSGDVKKYALCEEKCGDHDHTHEHKHIHFHCSVCKEILCVDIKNYPSIDLPAYRIDSLEIQANGVCAQCR